MYKTTCLIVRIGKIVLTALFCSVDDFCRPLAPAPVSPGKRRRHRSLCESEIITLLIAFHQSQYRCFKAFYLGYVCRHLRAEFPRLVSYHRFIEWVPSIISLLAHYLTSLFGKSCGVSYLDSTPLAVCHNKRIAQHKVFKGQAQRGKTSVGWFYGFKLHLAINHRGELLSVRVTPGNVHDVKPVSTLLENVSGTAYADKGYLSKPLSATLKQAGVTLITKVRKNMQAQDLCDEDTFLLGKRSLIETVIDQIKNQSQVQHTRHRAQTGFTSNVMAALIAYCHQPKKPSLDLV